MSENQLKSVSKAVILICVLFYIQARNACHEIKVITKWADLVSDSGVKSKAADYSIERFFVALKT